MRGIITEAHPEWHAILEQALAVMDQAYLDELDSNHAWLPGMDFLLAAFKTPLSTTRYILLGESPYPRRASANGYAFWDGAVQSLWSPQGLSKEVNRATSLRNLMKMLLFARGDLVHDFSKSAIAALDQSQYVQTAKDLFNAFIAKGFLLLNASLVYSEGQVPYHARQWRPFISSVLNQLAVYYPSLQLILFGKIAAAIPDHYPFQTLVAEHPYNISFITNKDVVAFFNPLNLLARHEDNNH